MTSLAFMPSGYTTTEFQLSSARFALVDAPPENPEAAAVARKSILISSFVAPVGTLMWKAYMSNLSRSHFTR